MPFAGRARAIPRPENRSPTLPTAVVGSPAARAVSSTVEAGGRTAKSLRSRVRTNAPTEPANGRAMTRPTSTSPVSIARAEAHQAWSWATGTVSTWAATWKTLSAEV